MLSPGNIIRWNSNNLLQVQGLYQEYRNDIPNVNPAGLVSKPDDGKILLIYLNNDTSHPVAFVHGNRQFIPVPEDGETIIYDPNTGQNLIKVGENGIEIVGDVTINGSLTLNRSSGGGGPVAVNDDPDTRGDTLISPL